MTFASIQQRAKLHFGATRYGSLQKSLICSSTWRVGRAKSFTIALCLAAIWGGQSTEQVEYLRVFVGQLRKKLEPDAPPLATS